MTSAALRRRIAKTPDWTDWPTVRLHDLSDAQLGALLLAWHGALTWRGGRWIRDGHAGEVPRGTFTSLTRIGLARTHSTFGRTYAALTPAGFRLADLAVTLSRQIAAGVVGLDASSLLPVVEEPIAPEPDASPSLRFSTGRTPRSVIGAQLRHAGKEIVDV